MDTHHNPGLDTLTQIQVYAGLQRALDYALKEQNAMSQGQNARDAIKSMRGSIGRVTDHILKTKAEIDAAEQEAIDLTGSVKDAQFKEFSGIKDELNTIINDLKDTSNGPPPGPLPGAEPSATSVPASSDGAAGPLAGGQ